MDAYFVDPKTCTGRRNEDAMIRLFKRRDTDLIVAAGYMRVLMDHFVKEYRNRIINIHPALLPSFPAYRRNGRRLSMALKLPVHRHFIDEGTDTGR